MSILIKGMNMPTRCEACFAYRFKAEYGHGYCRIANAKILGHGNARLNNCPLVEIPPHGRLIDADALKTLEIKDCDGVWEVVAYKNDIDAATTIIEAEDNND